MKTISIIITLTLGILSSTHAQNSPKKIQKSNSYETGVKLISEYEFSKAIPFFTDAINRNDKCIDCYFNRALCRQMTEQWSDAIRDLNIYFDLQANTCALYYAFALRSECYVRLNQYKEALVDIQAAINSCDGCYGSEKKINWYYLARGDIKKDMLDFNGAIEDYNKVLNNKEIESFMRAEAANRMSMLHADTYKHDENYYVAITYRKQCISLRDEVSDYDYSNLIRLYSLMITNHDKYSMPVQQMKKEACEYIQFFKSNFPDSKQIIYWDNLKDCY